MAEQEDVPMAMPSPKSPQIKQEQRDVIEEDRKPAPIGKKTVTREPSTASSVGSMMSPVRDSGYGTTSTSYEQQLTDYASKVRGGVYVMIF